MRKRNFLNGEGDFCDLYAFTYMCVCDILVYLVKNAQGTTKFFFI